VRYHVLFNFPNRQKFVDCTVRTDDDVAGPYADVAGDELAEPYADVAGVELADSWQS
jgi:hypothetical protein